ncbi:MAG: AAC(3) family N-acetyltransferase [Armatimonadota bacterium]|nr:AAC(3) family N-acetyltransferase [Armatimonadota bacterium]
MVTKEHIAEGLRALGLQRGDSVVVHSSLSSFGRVEGGPHTVVEAILEVIGNEGTLVVPTCNYEPGVFDPETTPSVVGAITEAVRKHPNAVRSKHPTHSVAAIGQLAEIIVEDHEKTHAFGRGSALFKLLQANGKILLLGTDLTTCSMVHVAEEIAEVPYLDRQRNVAIKTPNGKVVRRWVRRPGCSRGFGVLEGLLRERGQLAETQIGKCAAKLIKARDVVEAALEMLRNDPESLLCKQPDCGTCAEARAMIAARRTEEHDREVTELSEQEEQTIRLIEKQFENVTIEPFEIAKGDNQPN